MSNIFNFDMKKMKPGNLSKTGLVVLSLVVLLAIAGAFVGYRLYQKMTTNTVVAYFTDTMALYPGDRIDTMGLEVGQID